MTTTKEQRRVLTIRIPAELHQQLKQVKEEDGRSLNSIVQELIKEKVEK